MQMVDEDRLVGGESLDRYLQESEGSSRISQLNKLPFDIPSDAYQGLNIAKHAEQKALELLLDGAGLKAGDLPGCEPAEVLKLSGQILRHMVAGLTSLMKERKALKNALRLSHTNIQSNRQNPLKLAPSLDDALKYLLGNASKSCLPAQEAVQASFLEVKNHEKAVPTALVHALKEFMENFAPDELRQQVDRGVKRSRLLGAPNKLKYWDLFEQSYTDLAHGPDDTLPEAFSQEFSRAYAHAVESLKSAAK
jgi:type VI secretion system protein